MHLNQLKMTDHLAITYRYPSTTVFAISPTTNMETYSPPLLELPLHLLSIILAQLDSMQSLGSTILSHSLFYDAFNDDTKRVVRSILRNQIPPELICYAEATFKAQMVDNNNNDGKEASKLLLSAFESFGYELWHDFSALASRVDLRPPVAWE